MTLPRLLIARRPTTLQKRSWNKRLRIDIGALSILLALGAACDPAPEPPVQQAVTKTASQYCLDARRHLDENRYQEAATAAQAGLALYSTDVELHNLLATCYAAEGRYALAIQSLETALQLKPQFVTALLNLGGIYTKLGQNDRAIDYLHQASTLRPDNSAIHRRLGEVYLANAQYDRAAGEFEAALRLFPDDATLLYYLGQSLQGAQRDEEALQALQRATLLDIGFADAFYRLGLLARKLGRPQVATTALERFNHLRRIGGGQSAAPKQVERLRAAILNAPEESQHHYNLGLLFVRQGYFAEARNKFDRATALENGSLDFALGLARDLAELQQPGVALRYLEAALAQHEAHGPALLTAGQLAGQLQRYDRSVEYFRAAVQLQPDQAEGWYFLGLSLNSLGDKEEATSALKRCSALDGPQGPFGQKAKRILTELETPAPTDP